MRRRVNYSADEKDRVLSLIRQHVQDDTIVELTGVKKSSVAAWRRDLVGRKLGRGVQPKLTETNHALAPLNHFCCIQTDNNGRVIQSHQQQRLLGN